MDEPSRFLQEVSGALADGRLIDWGEVERRLKGSGNAKVAEGLRLAQLVSAGCNGQPVHGSSDSTGSVTGRLFIFYCLLAFSGAQMVCAMVLAAFSSSWPNPVPAAPVVASILAFGGGGLVLGLGGRRDSRALWLAGFFLCVASASCQRFLTSAVAILPAGGTVSVMTAVLPETLLPFFLWSFIAEFPRIVGVDRWVPIVRAGRRLSGAIGSVLFLFNAFARLTNGRYDLSSGAMSLLLRQPAGPYWLVLSWLCLMSPVIALVRMRRARAAEQERVRLFLLGLAAGVSPLFSVVIMESISPGLEQWMSQPGIRYWSSVVVYGCLLTIPMTSTYSILVHGILNVRLALRGAARLALMRWALFLFVALPVSFVAVNLYLGRSRPLATLIVESPMPALLAVSLLGLVIYSRRHRILERFETVLMGKRMEPSLVLASFSLEARYARSLEDLSQSIRERLADLVSADGSVLMVRDRRRNEFVPVEGGLRSLPASSGFASLLSQSGSPLSFSDGDPESLLPWLVEEDRHWISDGQVHLVAPLLGQDADTAALLIVGPSRSGLPYTEHDRKDISALSSSASILVSQILNRDSEVRYPNQQAVAHPAGQCKVCDWITETADGACRCGAQLGHAAIPYELSGKFRLDAFLGQGGMGVVYRALDLTLGRLVALKTLPQLRADALSRLRQEARSMAGFVHPNVALIFGLETWKGTPVLVIEYLAKGCLASRLGSALSVEETLRVGIDLATGLEAIHARGLLHRDIKPSNVGLAADGSVKLLDFGLAHLAEEVHFEARSALNVFRDLDRGSTLTGQIVGTPLYMSPEALAGESPSVAQDLWALHLLLWECVAGRHPLADEPSESVLRKLAKGRIPSIRTFSPHCAPEIAAVLAEGLNSDPRRRKPNAAAVRASLIEIYRMVAT